MAYEVKLEVFEGPIDLLLHLITRQRVDIYDVSISTITEEYLEAVGAIEDLDLESATGFLVVAATLLELKSARLLPAQSLDDADGHLLEERDMLLARLVELSTLREAGAWIAVSLEKGAVYMARTAGLEPQFVGLAPDLLARVTPADLASSAALVLAPRPEVLLDTSHVAPITASVKDAISDISTVLQLGGAVAFADLCAATRGRIEVVVRFLALLELFKAGAIELSQDDRFGEIRAQWTNEVAAEDVVEEAEEYTIDLRDEAVS
ncbi:MAG TPA: ScpA family protein [Acidimicrobiia bacterium]|nr:ScpA family protein [Acidimicrobiia bacterium]